MEKLIDINAQGLSIRCKLFYEKDLNNIDNIVIILHGFGSSKDLKSNTKFGERFTAKYKHSAVIAFDLPCHGTDARKKLSVAECLTYLQIVIDYAYNTLNAKTLSAYGTSLGGYLVLDYISKHNNPFQKIALRAPAINIYYSLMNRLSEVECQKLAKGKDVLVGFDRQMKINKSFFDELAQNDVTKNDYLDYAEQILILHGTEDEIVSLQTSQQFADNNVIELIAIEGADHTFSNPKLMDITIGRIITFLANQ